MCGEILGIGEVSGIEEAPASSRRLYEQNQSYFGAWALEVGDADVVRAVTPGSFVLPAVNVSDMYAPRVYARSGMGNVAIAPR